MGQEATERSGGGVGIWKDVMFAFKIEAQVGGEGDSV